jgi:hypothetical protein
MRRTSAIKYSHLLPVHRVASDPVDYFACRLCKTWNAKPEIEFLNLSSGELSGQSHVRDVILGDHKTSAGLFVEPMHHARPQFTTDSAQARNAVKQRIHERPRLDAGSRVNRHPGRLVYHDEVFILV